MLYLCHIAEQPNKTLYCNLLIHLKDENMHDTYNARVDNRETIIYS